MSVETSGLWASEDGKKLLQGLEDPWLQLILAMVWEYLNGEKSRWKPYFDVLPSTFNTLMFWSDQELEMLQASAVRHKIGRSSADETLRENIVNPILNSSPFQGLVNGLGDEDALALAHRFGSTIMAYAFDLEKDPSGQTQDEEGYVSDDEDELLPKGMVPMADMLNADADRNNAHLYYSESKVIMRALVPIKAGDEIFNDYGPLPRADLLRRYGYLTPNYAQYDVVEIPSALVIEHLSKHGKETDSMEVDGHDGLVEQKLDWLGEYDIYEDGFDLTEPLEEDALFPKELQLLFQTLNLSEEEFKVVSKKEPKLKRPTSPHIFDQYHNLLQARLAQYSTSAEDDRTLVQKLQQGPSDQSATRKLMAIHVRMGEKELLSRAIENVARLANSSRKIADNDKKRSAPDAEPQNKKQKRR